MKVPIFDLKFTERQIDAIVDDFRELLSEGFIGEGNVTKCFEKDFAKFQKSRYAVATSSGTGALEIALKASNVKNREVLLPSNTFFATGVAVRNAGGYPVLCDIDKENYGITLETVERFVQMSNHAAAVILVHIGGWVSPESIKIAKFCKNHNITLIEDCAHAHGAFVQNKFAGNIGDFGCFSFFPTKVMTTGEGGMVVCNNLAYYETVKSLKNFGRNKNNPGICDLTRGNNFKISDITALIGYHELKRVKERIRRRQEINSLYYWNLINDSRYNVRFNNESGYSCYKTIVEISNIDRDALFDHCKEHDVSLTGEVYRIPIHDQPAFNWTPTLGVKNTNHFKNNHICPPNYPELTDSQVEYVCDVLKSFR